MNSSALFYIIITIIVVSFLIDKVLDALNAKRYNDVLPEDLRDVYDDAAYKKSQNYNSR